jgi:hypothetical protein
VQKGQYTNPWFDGAVKIKRAGVKNLEILICGCKVTDGVVSHCAKHEQELARVCKEDVVAAPVVVECAEKIEGPGFMAPKGAFDALYKSFTPIVMEYTSSTHHDANRRVLPVSPSWLDTNRGTRKFFAIDLKEYEEYQKKLAVAHAEWVRKGQRGPKPVFEGPPTKCFFVDEAKQVRVGEPIPFGDEIAVYARKTHAFVTYSRAQ